MVSFSVKTRVLPDRTLQVATPTGLPEADVDVLVVVRPVAALQHGKLCTSVVARGIL